jgi:hypothetical protein
MGAGGMGTTDVVLALVGVLAVGIVISVRRYTYGQRTGQMTPAPQVRAAEEDVPVVDGPIVDGDHDGGDRDGSIPWPAIGARFVIAVAVIFSGISLAMGLSLTPYNLATLFPPASGIVEQIALTLGLISIGLGAVFTGQRLARSRRPYFSLPFWISLTALVSYALFAVGLRQDVLDGLTGPAILFGQLRDGQQFGSWGVDLVAALGPDMAQGLLAVVEPFFRFAALVIPLSLSLALFTAALWQLERFPSGTVSQRLRHPAADLFGRVPGLVRHRRPANLLVG